MEAREDAELGCDAWNEDTFGDLMEEWQVGDDGESCFWRDASPARGGVEEELQDEDTRGRCRDSRICRCALDALRPRRVRVAVDVVVNGCECEEDASAGVCVCVCVQMQAWSRVRVRWRMRVLVLMLVLSWSMGAAGINRGFL